MTYEQLDLIADAYTPLLLMLTLFSMAINAMRQGVNQTIGSVVALVFGVMIVYTVMFVDIALNLWPYFGSDYSTHTAIALVFVSYFSLKSKPQMMAAIVSLVAYFALMVYQQYHTVLDILSTSLIMLPVLLWLQLLGHKNSRLRKENEF